MEKTLQNEQIFIECIFSSLVISQQPVLIPHSEHQTLYKSNIYNSNTLLLTSAVSRDNQNSHLEKSADVVLPEKRTSVKGFIGVNKTTIKSEYSSKTEKCVSNITDPNQSACNQLSQKPSRTDVYSDKNVNSQLKKESCVSLVNASQSPSPCATLPLSVQQPQIAIDSEGPQQTRSAFESTNGTIPSHLNIEDQYLREQQLRYSQQICEINNIARPSVSYPSELVSNRPSYELSSSRSFNSSSAPISTAFERYDPLCMPQRANMYPYMQHTLDDINIQHNFIHEQQMSQSMMKVEQEESAVPIYHRPIYHYDQSGPLPPGFSAINLSVKVGSIPSCLKGSSSSPAVPIIDLSTSGATSCSPQVHNFAIRVSESQPKSPHLVSSRVPSPQGQTLDLSVSRISQW